MLPIFITAYTAIILVAMALSVSNIFCRLVPGCWRSCLVLR